MSALIRTIIFLVRSSRLRVSNLRDVIRDFYEDSVEQGRHFSFYELRDLVKVILDADYFCESPMFEEFLHYALPFFEK